MVARFGMATEIVPPGVSDMTAYFALSGNTLKFMGGEQELTNCNKPAITMASIQIAKESRVWNQAANAAVLVGFRKDSDQCFGDIEFGNIVLAER